MEEAAGPSSRAPPSSSEGASEPPVKRPKTAIQQFPQIRRNGHGRLGRTCRLVTNHFAVTFAPQSVTHYTVSINTADARPLKSNLKRRVIEILRETYDMKQFAFAYDGEQALFVAGDLSFRSKEFVVHLPDRGDDGQRAKRADDARRRAGNEFVVQIDFATLVDMNAVAAVCRGERDIRAQDALRILDIMIREHAAKQKYVLQRDCSYSQVFGRGANLSGCCETWKGFHASFRTTQTGLSLNLDTATTIMIKETKVEVFMEDHCKKKSRQFADADYHCCKRLLKGILVVDSLKRTHRVSGFSPQPCSDQTFPLKRKDANGAMLDPEDITIADYFAKVKGISLNSTYLRALDVGRPKKPTYIPIEHCVIAPGQRYKKSLNTAQRQGMIRECKVDPNQRVRIVTSMMEKNDYNHDEMLQVFGVRFDDKLTRLEGRVLEPPQLQFGRNHKEVPRNGRWNFNIDRQMNQPASTRKWILVWFKNRRTQKLNARKIGNDLIEVGVKKGMKFGPFELFEENDRDDERMSPLQRVERMIDRLRNVVKDKTGKPIPADQWPFIVAILPEKSRDLYIPFKKICETQIGIVTQCIVPPNGQANPKYLSSVSLKVNLKLGGYNSVLASEEARKLPKISSVPTIIIGLDVAHGSVGDANAPSVAAGVGTVEWPRFSRYTCSIRAQEPKAEIIKGLHEIQNNKDTGMVAELLTNFFKAARKPDERKPQQILVFRDGVSESQFDQVLDRELRAFKDACRSMEANYNPKITFVVVQKKHHTRFFLEPNFGNVAPGTVVDTGTCHPRNNDFYMVSHAAIGTSRPTHYHVLWDEIGFSADDLQMITHGLCYTYSRCTSAVSVVAPAYYAHVAAAHSRNFVDSTDSGSESVRSGEHARRAADALPKLHECVLQKMFYV